MKKVRITFTAVLGLLIVFGMFSFYGVNLCHAAAENQENIILDTGDNAVYTLPDITDLTSDTIVTMSCDNTYVAGVSYGGEAKDEGITLNGNEQELTKGKWTASDLRIEARRAGTAVVTVNIATVGKVTSKSYYVTVNGTEPVFFKKLIEEKKIRTCDEVALILPAKSNYAKITISSNKNKAFKLVNTASTKEKTVVGKIPQEIKWDEVTMIPIKSGKISVIVTVEQDGKVYSKTYKLKVAKYVNPIASFKIGQKDFAKKFDKKTLLRDGRGLSVRDCKYTLGGKTYKITMKKGYKLVKITYRRYNEWGGVKPHTLKGSTLPKDFWELHIIYKDKKGRKWSNDIIYSVFLFM